MKADLPDKLYRLLTLWKQYAPTRKFMGMTAEEFEVKTKRLGNHMDAMKALDFSYSAMIATRETLADELNLEYQRIVSIIWGDEAFGPFSEFIRGLGYKTLDEYDPPGSEGGSNSKPPSDTPPG